jgi:hypothetical protein
MMPYPRNPSTRASCVAASIMLAAALTVALSPSPGRAQSTGATVVLPGFRGVVRLDSVGTSESIPGGPGEVFSAVRAAFDSLGIEQALHDSSGGVVGNLELRLTRKMAGRPMSHWVDCGVGHTGPTANLYRVHLAILVWVTPASEGGSKLKTAVAAGAQALGGPLADPIACQSTGALEDVVLAVVRSHRTSP